MCQWNWMWLHLRPLAPAAHPGKHFTFPWMHRCFFSLYFHTFQNNLPKDRNQKPKSGIFLPRFEHDPSLSPLFSFLQPNQSCCEVARQLLQATRCLLATKKKQSLVHPDVIFWVSKSALPNLCAKETAESMGIYCVFWFGGSQNSSYTSSIISDESHAVLYSV